MYTLSTSDEVTASFLAGGGDLGARMRAFDWSSTSLGPAEGWPQSLKTCIRIILTSRQPMFVWWGEELINLYNDAYRAIVGGKHPTALAQPASVVWREIWDQIEPRAATAMRSNEGTYDEALLLIMERNGYPEETYYTFSYSPVPNDQGGTGGIICANTDDTQRIIGERQLALLRELATSAADARTVEEACARSAASLDTNPRDLPFAMIYLTDRERNSAVLAGSSGIAAGDPAAPQAVSLDDDAAWPFAEILRSQKPTVVSDLATRFASLPAGAWDRPPREAVAVTIANTGQAGKVAVLIVGLNPFRLYDDSYSRFIELIAAQLAASIGHAQAYEDERQRAEALAELDRAKTAFFSNVSHEFRTPLTLMLAPLEDILAKPESEVLPENRELLAVMHRNGQRLLKLVNTLLDFARIEAGRVQAHYEPVDLAVYTADLASVFRAAIERAGMRLIVDTPPAAEPVYVDRDMWEKIVLNLVSNAFKYTLEGEIAVALHEDDGAAVLTVRDTGTGIPPEELPKLFNRFHRVQGARGRTHEGTGIGLALVQELARLHGGTVTVESTVGVGTSFTVRVPLGSAHLPQDRVSTPGDAARRGAAKQYLAEALRWLPDSTFDEPADVAAGRQDDGAPRPKIVLADDNADMREYVRRLLLPFYDVIAVVDGVEALEAARTAQPDLVLTDVMMPRLDGFGLLDALRRNESTASIPVIMLSARAGEEARVEGLEAGADDYLVKPFTARELLARVGGTLTLARVRREADKALEAERLGLREIFMQAPAFIATLRGPEHVFEVTNPPYIEIIGGKRDVIGKPVREALPEVHGQGFFELLDQVYTTGQPYVGQEVRVELNRDGQLEERFVDFVYHPLRDPHGHVNGIFVHGNDVTAQVLARQQLERQAAELERAKEALEIADRRKDEFIATLSHELRTPLTAILGWARLLQLGGLDAATARAAIETIDHSARAQAQLIDDVLDISRITSGKVRIASEVVNVATVALAAIETVRLAAHARGVRVFTDAHVQDQALILGDENRLQQVIWNLLSNAIKFTPEGGEVRLTVRGNGAVTVVVEDNGIGIRPDFLPHVFEAFRQAESTTTRVHGGLGLGLSIVRYLVELHGGQIIAESAGLGSGAKFTVELPRLRPGQRNTEAAAPMSRASSAPAMPAARQKGRALLVVDDQEMVRAYVTAVLVRAGAEVRGASSVEEAMALVEQQLPDLVLCDLAMPHADGFAFVDRLRAALPDHAIPVLAVTALGRPDDEARVRASGFAGYVRKPVDPEALTAAVVNALSV
jgi:signal transduction histidine kinase/DNA-binding response OmpR family regulator